MILPLARHTRQEVIKLAKQGMKRPQRTHTKPRNQVPPVPELQGKEKTGKKSAPDSGGEPRQ